MIVKIVEKVGDPIKVKSAVEIFSFERTDRDDEIIVKFVPHGKEGILSFSTLHEYMEIITNNGERIAVLRVNR